MLTFYIAPNFRKACVTFSSLLHVSATFLKSFLFSHHNIDGTVDRPSPALRRVGSRLLNASRSCAPNAHARLFQTDYWANLTLCWTYLRNYPALSAKCARKRQLFRFNFKDHLVGKSVRKTTLTPQFNAETITNRFIAAKVHIILCVI